MRGRAYQCAPFAEANVLQGAPELMAGSEFATVSARMLEQRGGGCCLDVFSGCRCCEDTYTSCSFGSQWMLIMMSVALEAERAATPASCDVCG